MNKSLLVGCFLIAFSPCRFVLADREVFVAQSPKAPWQNYPTRILADLPEAATSHLDTNFSTYGGWLDHKTKATGFFRTEKVGDRWWLVDPSGFLFLHKGVACVEPGKTPGAIVAMNKLFGSQSGWANQTVSMLHDLGFNGAGAWSDTELLSHTSSRLVYTQIWNFMGAYSAHRGGTTQQSAHTDNPHKSMFVFDPNFEAFCDDYAKQLAKTKDDPWLLGNFSDNELPFHKGALRGYLALPTTDPGYVAAKEFLTQRHGEKAGDKDITGQDERDFVGIMVDRYYKIVSRAIKKYDPNHLYLGTRFYTAIIRFPEIFKACGPYVDVISVNYYRAWTPNSEMLAMWARESGRPCIISEWYAKGVDSGLPNTGGLGWLVKTQQDRAWFYQNFTLGLLESKNCVGWHWFRYMDNDPDDTTADSSNRDSNKGLVNNRYVPYEPLVNAMKEINQRAYSLTDYFDGQKKNADQH
jgi:hypothetical protein